LAERQAGFRLHHISTDEVFGLKAVAQASGSL
jgi:dTDP-D-glucose 4,6-dehydratase